LDLDDSRAAALIHLISILPLLNVAPTYIFLENVVGFEDSESRKLLISCLLRMGYAIKEWHLSPVQFGIPNERPRYYLTAELSHLSIQMDHLSLGSPVIIKKFCKSYISRTLEEFLDSKNSDNLQLPVCLLKARKFISKSEISKASDTRTKCFTKAYGHHGLHSGCFLMTKSVDDKELQVILEDPLEASKLLGLRMFSPEEISRIHMFPKTFEFPSHISLQQRWKLLGNSMNIMVVSELLALLFKCNLR
jgi:tRNA (cytosine38-C5)-methyltransferase